MPVYNPSFRFGFRLPNTLHYHSFLSKTKVIILLSAIRCCKYTERKSNHLIAFPLFFEKNNNRRKSETLNARPAHPEAFGGYKHKKNAAARTEQLNFIPSINRCTNRLVHKVFFQSSESMSTTLNFVSNLISQRLLSFTS